MAPGVVDTAVMTAPVEVSSWVYLQASPVSVSSSKAPRVPEPASRPMKAISASAPPTWDQLVISPLAIWAICSTVRSSTVLAGFTTMAMPSLATTVSVREAFSSSFRPREDRPMSAEPLEAASIPVPEPVGS